MEEALGKKLDSKRKERSAKLKEKMLQMPEICIERGYLLTESYKETEGEPPIIRRAKGLSRVLEEMTLGVDEGELIVGRSTSKPRGGMLIPEVQWEWYLKEMDLFSTRPWDRTAPLSEEEKGKMREFLPYWKGKCLYDRWQSMIPDEIKKIHDAGIYITNTGVVSGVHLAHPTVDYERVLKEGLKGIKKQVDEKIESLVMSDMDYFNKYQFLHSIQIVITAAIGFAHRYASLVEDMAEKETDLKRKAELEAIAQICWRVPEYPAESFHEALQSLWLTYIVLRIEGLGPGLGFGRADQFLYPFYQKDIPVLFYFSKETVDLHKPTDDPEKIIPEKMAKIGKLVFSTAWVIANMEGRPKLISSK